MEQCEKVVTSALDMLTHLCSTVVPFSYPRCSSLSTLTSWTDQSNGGKTHHSRKVLFSLFFLWHFQSTIRNIDKVNSILPYILYPYLCSYFSGIAVSLFILPQSIFHYQNIPEKKNYTSIPTSIAPFPQTAQTHQLRSFFLAQLSVLLPDLRFFCSLTLCYQYQDER